MTKKSEKLENITYALIFISVITGLLGFLHWMNSLGIIPYLVFGLEGAFILLVLGVVLNWFGAVLKHLIRLFF